METKKNLISKIISLILSLIVTAICILIYYKRLVSFLSIPIISLSVITLFIMFAFAVYTYFNIIINFICKKKFLIPILLVLILVLAVYGIYFIKDNVNYIFRNIILKFIYVFGVVCLPFIMIIALLKENNKIKMSIAIILLIFTYITNFSNVMYYAQQIIIDFSSYSLTEIFSSKEEEKTDRTYLENYANKFAENGYLSKYDIEKIIDISDLKSALIYINYIDEENNINIKITNKQDDEIKKLKEKLESDYYTFNYQAENTETTINIEKYVINKEENKEKNEDINLYGYKFDDYITNVEKKQDKEYFYFENIVNVDYSSDKYLDGFKILFAYDETSNNFVPVVSDIREYSLIEKYSITNDKILITLKNGIELNNKDYTLRINRYNDNIDIEKSNDLYYYDYEPLVTQNGNVLEIKFGNNYTIKTLKNIEIIFGKVR